MHWTNTSMHLDDTWYFSPLYVVKWSTSTTSPIKSSSPQENSPIFFTTSMDKLHSHHRLTRESGFSMTLLQFDLAKWPISLHKGMMDLYIFDIFSLAKCFFRECSLRQCSTVYNAANHKGDKVYIFSFFPGLTLCHDLSIRAIFI